MNPARLTTAEMALLRAVAEGKVDRLGSCAYYADLGGRLRRQVTDRARKLDTVGLINPLGVAMKHGKPMPSDEQFPDYYLVTLTSAGRQALETGAVSADDGPGGEDGEDR